MTLNVFQPVSRRRYYEGEELGARVKTAPLSVHRGGFTGLFSSPLMQECFGGSFEWN